LERSAKNVAVRDDLATSDLPFTKRMLPSTMAVADGVASSKVLQNRRRASVSSVRPLDVR
jgi:hypothetical protein